MTCRAEKRLFLAALSALAFGGALAAAPSDVAPDEAIAEAEASLERGDGLGAEMAGKRALELGARRNQVAAFIGEGELLQGQHYDAREWLGSAEFDAATRQRGLHALARLELAQDDLPAAAQAFDRMLQAGPVGSLVWVDIGRMRYLAGEHHAALDAARQAVRIDPQEPRALEFLGLLIRDAQGVNDALALFRDALQTAPTDMGLLSQYAATLGDAGQHGAMLRVARRMVAVDGRDPRAFYMQAVLAARSGQDDLGRRLIWRMGDSSEAMPAALMLTAILEYRSGNYALATEGFDSLLRRQPLNETVQLMFARALLANGEGNEVIAMLEAQAMRSDASSYLLTLVGRAFEQLGERDRAAPYLDRASRMARQPLLAFPAVLPPSSSAQVRSGESPVHALRFLLTEGRAPEAQELARDMLAQYPSSIDLQLLAGDVHLLSGNPAEALGQYRHAAQARSNWPLVQRMAAALIMLEDSEAARREVAAHLAQNPRASGAAALLGRMQRDAGNPARATVLLRHAAGSGAGSSDPLLLAELAELEMVVGDMAQAERHAVKAHDLQRGNRRVARALSRLYAMRDGQGPVSLALAAKSRGHAGQIGDRMQAGR